MGCSLSMLQKKNGNKKGGDGEKKEKGSITVVFKVDCLCEGCATKILKYIHDFEGIIIFFTFKISIFLLGFPSLFLLHFFSPIHETFSAFVIYSVFLFFFFFFICRGGDSENREQLKQSDSEWSCGSNSH